MYLSNGKGNLMILYPCYKQDLWINLEHLESISLSQTNESIEVRGHTSDNLSGFYVLEIFDNRLEALKFIKYLTGQLEQ